MPATLDTPAEQSEAPALGIAPSPIANPVIDDSGIKAMSSRFRDLMKSEAKPEAQPAPHMRQEPPLAPKPPESAAPAPDATKPTPEPEEPALDERNLSSAARESFKRLKDSQTTYKKQVEEGRKVLESQAAKLKELEAETARFKSLGVNPDEFQKTREEREKLAKENEQMLAQLETLNLERSPRFQNWWKLETKKHLDIVGQLAPDGKRDELIKLVMEPVSNARNEAIDKILEESPKANQRMIERAWENLEAVKQQRAEALTQGSERWKELQAHEHAEKVRLDSIASQRKQALASAALQRADMMSAFQPNPDDPTHNSEIAARKEFVRAVVEGRIDEDVALGIPAAAVEYLYLANKVVPGLKAELAKRDELIKQLQGSSPRNSNGNAPSQRGGSDPQSKPGESFMSKVKELWPGQRTA